MRSMHLLALTGLVSSLLFPSVGHAAAVAADVGAAPSAAEEPLQVDDHQVRVRNSKDVTIDARGKDEDDVQSRELWYSSSDGKGWSDWQKHGIVFAKGQVISWSPSEGHWRIYLRKVKVSGQASVVPTPTTKAQGEFIIDRTPPTAAILFPGAKAKLRGGQKYVIKWEATDKYLKGAPVSLRWSRDGKGTYDTIADGIANNGAYEWTVPKDMTTAGQLQILVADKAGNVAIIESASVLVDSVNPKGKVVGPPISAKLDVNLDLEIADVGPAGLSAARLWVSSDDGASWSEGPFISEPFKSVAWKANADGKFRLAVVATDQAGNSSPVPKKGGDDQFAAIVDTTAPTLQLASALGVVEADKPSSNRRAFIPGVRVQIPFIVKDANLAPNSVSIFFQSDASKPWREIAKNQATDAAFRFEVPAEGSKSARVKLSAADLAGNIGEVTSSEPFEIDTKVDDDTVELK